MNIEDLQSAAGRGQECMSRLRSVADWFSVRDPGWGRAQMGWRTLVGLVAGMAAGYFVAQAVGLPPMLGLSHGSHSTRRGRQRKAPVAMPP
jgi:hypothetical protein